MSQDYAFKFYNPKPVLTPEGVMKVLSGFAARGAQVTDYELTGQIRRPRADQAFDPAGLVAQDGSCLIGLCLPSPIGDLDVTLQAFPQESKGAQMALSLGEDVFNQAPNQIAPLLLELAKVVNLHLPLYFGWGDHELQLERMEEHLRFDRIGALAWANLFGPEMVRRIGAERIKALPIHQVQVFKQGALCLLTPAPGQPLSAAQAGEIEAQWPGCMLPLR